MRRTERLFAIAEYLRGRRTGVTAEALAKRFNVTVRTMYRDLDALREASMPLHADRGRGGGYALDRSYALPPVNFTAREAALLVAMGRWIDNLRLLPLTATLNSALDKVRAALPASSQGDLARLEGALSYVGVPALQPPAGVRDAVEQAWLDNRALFIRYEGARGVTERTVRIGQIIMERTQTLLNCHDLDKDEPRQFRLHKIVFAKLAREPSSDKP